MGQVPSLTAVHHMHCNVLNRAGKANQVSAAWLKQTSWRRQLLGQVGKLACSMWGARLGGQFDL